MMKCFIHSEKDAEGVCSSCGHPICLACLNKTAGKYLCDTCARQVPPTQVPFQIKNSGIAALLSFLFVGAGQIYNGDISKGILLIIVYSVSLALMLVGIGFCTTPILLIWGIYDAYSTAERINQRGS